MKFKWESLGEGNDYVFDVDDGNFILFSDPDGKNWELQYPEGETQRLVDCEDDADAKAEARVLIQIWLDAQG